MNDQQRLESNLKKLPLFCIAVPPKGVNARLTRLDRGQPGYRDASKLAGNAEDAGKVADELNAGLHVTIQQREAMQVGSLFGFHCPGADPDSYDEQGQPIKDFVPSDENAGNPAAMNTAARAKLTNLCTEFTTTQMQTLPVVHPVAKLCADKLSDVLGEIDTRDL